MTVQQQCLAPLSAVRIILCEPSHPGNIGACARAMKNMGLKTLFLVNPKKYPCAIATERAAGADDILANAKVVSTLQEAIGDCELIMGTSARKREIQWPIVTPKQCAEKVFDYSDKSKVAILFGTERSGLTNEALSQCHYHLIIPANPSYESLNLSQAVQVITYELCQRFIEGHKTKMQTSVKRFANIQETEGVLSHLEEVMRVAGFIEPKPTRILMMRLKRLLLRAQLEIEEVHILRGIFKAIIQKLPRNSLNNTAS